MLIRKLIPKKMSALHSPRSLFSYPTTIVSKSTCAEDTQLKLFILGDVIDK